MINIISTPDVLPIVNLIGNPVTYILSMDDIGDGVTNIKRCAYQLLTDTGVPISAIEVYSPKLNEVFPINFNKDIKEIIYTAVPEVDGPWTDRPEPEMLIKVKLAYWELVTNKETCEVTEENNAETVLSTVINSAEQWWGYVNDPTANTHLLSLVPENQYLCPTLNQLLYFYSNNPVPIIVTAYKRENGVNVAVYNQLITSTNCFSVNISPYLIASLAGVPLSDLYLLRVFMAGVNVTNYYIGKCCTKYRIAFMTFGGGYTYMDFDEGGDESASINFSEVRTFQPSMREYAPVGNTVGGLRINGKESRKLIRMSRSIKGNDFLDIKFLEDFVSSGNYYLQYSQFVGVGNDPDYKLFKRFIINSGTYKTSDDSGSFVFEITGYIAKDHKYPNYRI